MAANIVTQCNIFGLVNPPKISRDEAAQSAWFTYFQHGALPPTNFAVCVAARCPQDNLAMSAIRFLTTISRSVHYKLLQPQDVLKQVCESILIPNLRVRDEDEELFDMNPLDYIRRDQEGSDSDTRRRWVV